VKRFFFVPLAYLSCFLSAGCSEGPAARHAADGALSLLDSRPSDAVFVGFDSKVDGTPAGAPLLTADHMGYKRADCSICHEIPLPEHTETRLGVCATCHGGNGACDPNAQQDQQVHVATLDCMSCHGNPHEIHQVNTACVNCHFAAAGVDDNCGNASADGGADSALTFDAGSGTLPLPASQLITNCYHWPAEEFSPTNSASVKAVLPAGSRAIDFELADVSGKTTTLTGLLATKPVVLVTGSFT